MNLFSYILSSAVQLILFASVPFVWWLADKGKKDDFMHWVGLKKPFVKNPRWFRIVFSFSIIVYPLFVVTGLSHFLSLGDTAVSQFSGKGLSAFLPILLYSFLQTGLSEELLFRGFLNKRLSSRFGPALGNATQAFLFGLLHGILFSSRTSFFGAVCIVLLIGLDGWIMGYINENLADGSILPSWAIHGISNVITAVAAL